jgi:hypothetical protein
VYGVRGGATDALCIYDYDYYEAGASAGHIGPSAPSTPVVTLLLVRRYICTRRMHAPADKLANRPKGFQAFGLA